MRSIKLVCLFLALMLLGVGCKKKTTATKTRKDLTETKILLQAARVGDIERIQSLVSRSVDVNVKDIDGVTPLHSVVSGSQRKVAEFLIDLGADINAKTSSGWTPLHSAVSFGYYDVVEPLVEEGADVNAKNIQGQTPLQQAQDKSYKEIVELLRKHGAK